MKWRFFLIVFEVTAAISWLIVLFFVFKWIIKYIMALDGLGDN